MSLWISRPKADSFPLDYGVLSTNFSALLAGLGGFAITVLAVLLGLEALDVHRSSETKQAAHGAVVRHVSVSLAVASVTCFIGAQMLAEVSSQAASVHQARLDAKAEMTLYLHSAGLTEEQVAETQIRLTDAQSGDAYYEGDSATSLVVHELSALKTERADRTLTLLRAKQDSLDVRFEASARRHMMLATVPAFISSFLILQSLTFLLLIRFPQHDAIVALQNLVVLAFGAMLLIKLVHVSSYGLEGSDVTWSRVLVGLSLVGSTIGYGAYLRRKVVQIRASADVGQLRRFTPLFPYVVALVACFAAMLYLAATFGRFGEPSIVDRLVAAMSAILTTGFLLAIQVERPTLGLLEE